MINIAGWDWDEYLQHLVDIGIERKRWREYMIEELYPLPGNQIKYAYHTVILPD